jgi:hypothetical protein
VTLVQDRFLVGEVVVQGGLADAEVLGDVLERGGVVAVLTERPECRVKDLGTAPLPLAADVRG